MRTTGPAVWATCVAAAVGCARPAPPPPAPILPEPLGLRVVYPRLEPDSAGLLTATLGSSDSAFVFGSVTRPDAAVSVNGVPAVVAATGGWLAWVALPPDTGAGFDVVATADGERAAVAFRASLPPRFVPPPAAVWIDTLSLAPRGRLWVRPGEGIPLRVRGSAGASLRLLLDDSVAVPLVPDTMLEPRAAGELAFGTVTDGPPTSETLVYRGWLLGPAGPDPGPVLAPAPAVGHGTLIVEAVLDGDTVRVPWPLAVAVLDPARPAVAVLDDAHAENREPDGIVPGRPAPVGTYHWLFPNGTRAAVDGRVNDRVRLALSRRSVAWVDARDVHPLPAGMPPLSGTTESLRLTPDRGHVTLRIPTPGPVPFRVAEDGRRLTVTLYGVAANANWVQYGPDDPLVERIAFDAAAEDETTVTVDLSRPVWGYRTRWAGTDLLLEIRRPPALDARRPLRGVRVALDPGHPPVGSTGPTGAFEGDVVLAVAREAARLFRAAGASVVLLRDDSLPVALSARPRAAEAADADLLISVHANALPDGVNPFVNSGTSTYYFHPRAASFARHVNRAVVAQFGTRDLGIGRGDLAVARASWMPAILVEGLFMMLPDHEALLTSPAGQHRYAAGLVEGTRAFLIEAAARP